MTRPAAVMFLLFAIVLSAACDSTARGIATYGSAPTATLMPTAPSPSPSPSPLPNTPIPDPTVTPTVDPTPTVPPSPTPLPPGSGLFEPGPRNSFNGEPMVFDEPLNLDGDAVLELTGVHAIFHADVTLHDNARIVATDSYIEFQMERPQQIGLEAFDNSGIRLTHTDLKSKDDISFNWNFHGQSSIELIDVRTIGTDNWPWMAFGDATQATVIGSEFNGTLWDHADFDIQDSPSVFVELVFPAGSTVDEVLDSEKSDWTFPNENDIGIEWSVSMKNSVARGWGITVQPGSDITIRDARQVVTTLRASLPWDGVSVELSDLRVKLYEDEFWHFGDATLHFVNVGTWDWSPVADYNNTVTISDSDLADISFANQQGKVIVKRSRVFYVRAHEQVEITLIDCVVNGDVVAVDDGIVRLINSEVTGGIFEEGNGQVLVD